MFSAIFKFNTLVGLGNFISLCSSLSNFFSSFLSSFSPSSESSSPLLEKYISSSNSSFKISFFFDGFVNFSSFLFFSALIFSVLSNSFFFFFSSYSRFNTFRISIVLVLAYLDFIYSFIIKNIFSVLSVILKIKSLAFIFAYVATISSKIIPKG